MRKSIFILFVITVSVVILVVACTNNAAQNTSRAPKMDSAEMVERGRYLVNAMGCDDCHSPKRMGPEGPEIIPELRFSGFLHNGKIPPVDTMTVKKGWVLMSMEGTSFIGPWGASFSANISGDDTGIGTWSESQFLKAIREGKYKGMDNSRPLLPPMPWFVYKNMNDKDLKSIFAFLKTVKSPENVVPAPKEFSAL
jgi:hypothetical protein